jgi:hypothetical protein
MLDDILGVILKKTIGEALNLKKLNDFGSYFLGTGWRCSYMVFA